MLPSSIFTSSDLLKLLCWKPCQLRSSMAALPVPSTMIMLVEYQLIRV
jgi:hypothetical protein